jgi:nucleotidyltransferase/DNA polymerase involved in DNA repair
MQQSPSKWQKPSGLTVISGRELPEYLGRLPIGEVWGIGPQTSRYLAQFGIRTALDFAAKDAAWVKQHHLSKPYHDIWQELRGEAVLPWELEPKTDYQSVRKIGNGLRPSGKAGAIDDEPL